MSEHTYHLIVHNRATAQTPGNPERYELITSDLDTIKAELIIAREGMSPLNGYHTLVGAYLGEDDVTNENQKIDDIIRQARDALGYE